MSALFWIISAWLSPPPWKRWRMPRCHPGYRRLRRTSLGYRSFDPGGGGILLILGIVLSGATAASWLVDPTMFDRALAGRFGLDVAAERQMDRVTIRPVTPAAAPLPVPWPRPEPAVQIVAIQQQLDKKSMTIESVSEPQTAIEIGWEVGRPRQGERCGSELEFTPFEIGKDGGTDTKCEVVLRLVNRSAVSVSVDLAAGVLGRLREYTRENRHVIRDDGMLQAGESMRGPLDIPSWVRGEIQVRAVVLVSRGTEPAALSPKPISALELINTPPTLVGVKVSTIRLN
jgi:hypothetical protein